jgi:RNA-directed DNA polymerase
MTTQLEQIAAKAKADRTLRFISLAHLLTPAFLIETWRQMNRRGASGVDGETTTEFERELETRAQDICARLKAGTYRAPPVRRVEIPKDPGKVGTRPLGIPTVASYCTSAWRILGCVSMLNSARVAHPRSQPLFG